MTEPLTPSVEVVDGQLRALADRGAAGYDAARFHYIEALVRRAGRQREAVAGRLLARAARALVGLRDDFAAAQSQAAALAGQLQADAPASTEYIQRCYRAGDFDALAALARRLAQRETGAGLAGLNEHLRRAGAAQPEAPGEQSLEAQLRRQEALLTRAAGRSDAPAGAAAAPLAELRALRRCREGLARCGAEQRVALAKDACPPDSGPLNPSRLAARSLAIMGDVAPQYLHRFVAYFDTLLWLEQAEAQVLPASPRKRGQRRSAPGRSS